MQGSPGVQSAPPSAADRRIKRRRVLDILDRAGAESVLLTSQAALSWYLDGSRVHISLAGDPVAAVLVERDGDHMVTFNNEAERLAAEEVPEGMALLEVPWFANLQRSEDWFEGGGPPLAEAELARELRDARRSLLPTETERYDQLCRDAAAALTDVLTLADPQMTERQVAAQLAGRLVEAGVDPVVLLCAGESRAAFRHPLPTDAPLGRRAMAVVCARRDGLIANVTRWVRFGAADAAETDAELRILQVEAAAFAATVAGTRLCDVLAAVRGGYEAHGFGPDQWRLHHQGGAAGYNGRDPRATDATDDAVVANQAFAWNPSGPGVKVEDTVLLGASGIRSLSIDERWPTVEVAGRLRPATLQL
ncbi:M24 family metallopeptidase [Arthrobacter sp. UYP6]|uniref:M24 family metallopeptidase n=1 Tax=Arthrobacter sp. UYP6 TaxID=1756378 RepID=UPI0033916371